MVFENPLRHQEQAREVAVGGRFGHAIAKRLDPRQRMLLDKCSDVRQLGSALPYDPETA